VHNPEAWKNGVFLGKLNEMESCGSMDPHRADPDPQALSTATPAESRPHHGIFCN